MSMAPMAHHKLVSHVQIEEWAVQGVDASIVGCKAMGLSLFPAPWRPPFVVLPAMFYLSWASVVGTARHAVIENAAIAIEAVAKLWNTEWSSGLILRSSAVSETLEDRGAHDSPRLARDFGVEKIAETIESMFSTFRPDQGGGALAVVVQPLVKGRIGHLSSERRVSKTVNQWRWEEGPPSFAFGGVNSQRDRPPSVDGPLRADRHRTLMRLFGAVGSWVNNLNRGPAHLEWAYDGRRLWLLQLDFEEVVSKIGVDPRCQLREADLQPTGSLPSGSPFNVVSVSNAGGEWRKVANVRALAAARSEPFPQLLTLSGDQLERSIAAGYDLASDLDGFGHGRIVCRTDCKTVGIRRENLPRTHTVNSADAVKSMQKFLCNLKQQGALAEDICFILHKFIPAQTGAWVKADPANQIVVVDTLWGVPDGLQYLPHDTFEYDTRQQKITGERLRFKPRFIQEAADGTWCELSIQRSLGRYRSLSAPDVQKIAETSLSVAQTLGEPVLIMWFCGLPIGLGIGRNLPWFRMKPNPKTELTNRVVAPRWPKRAIRTVVDLEAVDVENLRKHILVLEPDVDLIRDDELFLKRVVQLANRNFLPVEIAGSALAHAFYLLEKEGVSVIPADESGWSRTRNRQSFDKLVRDDLPRQIEGQGELVVRTQLLPAEMRQGLVAKLLEEAQELLAARDPDDVKSELADLLEVVRAAASATGTTWEDVEATADEKKIRRGGFETGAVLVETAWPGPSRKTGRAPPAVSLRSLAKLTQTGQGVTVSFNALVAFGKDGVELSIAGRKLRAQLSTSGLCISDAEQHSETTGQPSLPFSETNG